MVVKHRNSEGCQLRVLKCYRGICHVHVMIYILNTV